VSVVREAAMTVVSYVGGRESIPGDAAGVDAFLVGELHKQTSSQVAGTQSSHALVRVLWTTQCHVDNMRAAMPALSSSSSSSSCS